MGEGYVTIICLMLYIFDKNYYVKKNFIYLENVDKHLLLTCVLYIAY